MKKSPGAATLQDPAVSRGFFYGTKRQQGLVTVVFLIIPMALLFTFTYLPFFKMIQFSFYNRNYLSEGTFVGLKNYVDVFKRDDCFKTLLVSVYYMLGAVVQLALALFFASLMVFKVKGSNIYKACLFFPYLICGIAVGFIFKFFFAHGYVLDNILMLFGVAEDNIPLWLQDTRINNVCLAATSVWRYTGQNMVMFLGAMMSVDNSLYEAASIDGANKWQQFRFIMLPSIKTIIVLNLILSISGSLSAFEPPYVITNGTMGTGTYFVIMNRIAHENQKVGLACAMAIVLLAIIVLCTIAQNFFFNRSWTRSPTGAIRPPTTGLSGQWSGPWGSPAGPLSYCVSFEGGNSDA